MNSFKTGFLLHFRRNFGPLLVLACVATVARAQTTYTNEATFLATAGSVTKESFETQPATNTRSQSTLALAGVTLQMSPGNEMGVFDQQPDFFGTHATDGTHYLVWEDGSAYMDFQFTSPVTAFGINVTDFGDFGSGTLNFSNNVGANYTLATAPRADGNTLFFGLVSNAPFTSARLSQTIAGETVGVDEFYFGAVPEPTSGAMLATFACVYAAFARRQKDDRHKFGDEN